MDRGQNRSKSWHPGTNLNSRDKDPSTKFDFGKKDAEPKSSASLPKPKNAKVKK